MIGQKELNKNGDLVFIFSQDIIKHDIKTSKDSESLAVKEN